MQKNIIIKEYCFTLENITIKEYYNKNIYYKEHKKNTITH
jgi:hypothetical protein